MRKIVLISLAITLLVVSGCSGRKNYSPLPTIDEEVKAEISAPVNCSTADRDIAILEVVMGLVVVPRRILDEAVIGRVEFEESPFFDEPT